MLFCGTSMESRNMACVPTFRLIAGPVRTPEQSPQPTDLNCSKSREQFSHSIVLKIRQPMRVAPVRGSGYPSLTTANLAPDRIDFATGLHWLDYGRKSGPIACRTFMLGRFHEW